MKPKNEDLNDEDRDLQNSHRLYFTIVPWGCIGTVLAAIISAIALLLSVLIKTPDSAGRMQPIIVVITQIIFNKTSEPSVTPIPDTPTITTTNLPTITPPATQTPFVTAGTDNSLCTESVVQPPTGTDEKIIVKPNEFHVWSSGDICSQYDGTEKLCVTAAPDLGYISVFRPFHNQETIYELSSLIPNYNWHGIYSDCTAQEQEAIINIHASHLSRPGDCEDKNGCGEIYIRIYSGSEFEVKRYSPTNTP